VARILTCTGSVAVRPPVVGFELHATSRASRPPDSSRRLDLEIILRQVPIIDPLLGTLQDNGGATFTHDLLPGSPAIDAASSTDTNGAPVTTDQRGITRPQGVANDIGAYEVLVLNLPPIVDDQSFDVVENGTSVGTVAADDPDLPNDTLTYSISGGLDAAKFDINSSTGALSFLSAPNLETPGDVGADNDYDLEVTVTDSNGAMDSANMVVNVLNVTAMISGTVFVDADGDGLFDGGTETPIDGVKVELLDSMFALLATDATELGGVYGFIVDDEFATYHIRQTQPTGVDDGAAILGDANGNGTTGEAIDGSVISSNEMELTLTGIDASDYDFTEVGQAVQAGNTATIGFWQNKNGQGLIKQGGPTLVVWLNSNFGNVLGSTFSDGNGGDDAAEVASFYKNEFFKKKLKGTSKVDAQFMSLALSTFFTSSNLSGGSVAAGYGFNVTDTGIGTNVVNVGNNGAAFSVADNTDMTIMALLLATNNLTGADADGNASEDYSHVYDADGDGVLDATELALRAMANDLYTFINESGDI
jgi:hypothetical protein